MEVKIDFELQEDCPGFDEHWDEDRRVPGECMHCHRIEGDHKGWLDHRQRMTSEGEKLAAFLEHFYGLEPLRGKK